MKKLLIVLFMALALCMGGCTDAPEAQKVLKSQGYTQVQTTGYQFFGCGKDDGWHTGFTAVSQNGTRVEGVVCSGFLKGATVRFN